MARARFLCVQQPDRIQRGYGPANWGQTVVNIQTKDDKRRSKMAALYTRTHGPECADKYQAIAEWWRLHAEESASPDVCFAYAAAQEAISDDMQVRPRHYRRQPANVSTAQWSKS